MRKKREGEKKKRRRRKKREEEEKRKKKKNKTKFFFLQSPSSLSKHRTRTLAAGSIPMQPGKQQTNPRPRRNKDRINHKVNTE